MAYYNKTRNLIYIHIYKAGGSFVRKILPAIGGGENDEGQEIVHKHARLEQVEAWFLEQGRFTDYLECITVVTIRNPYNWFVSLWNYIVNTPGHFMNNVVKDKTFAEYVDFYKAHMMVGGQYEHHLQSQFLRGQGKALMVKLEEINKLAVILEPLIGEVVIPHENKVAHKTYQQYYKGVDLSKLDFLEDECEMFGYDAKLSS